MWILQGKLANFTFCYATVPQHISRPSVFVNVKETNGPLEHENTLQGDCKPCYYQVFKECSVCVCGGGDN
jgi:hypothetical protein